MAGSGGRRMADHISFPARRRFLGGTAAAAVALAFPMVSLGRHRVFADVETLYSTRAVDLVREALVLDMLAPLKLDFRNSAFAEPISDDDAADFQASGITGFHHAVGLGGPDAYQEALAYMAAWSGFAGRNSHIFSLIGSTADLERAKAEGKAGVIMGIQNAEQFRTA